MSKQLFIFLFILCSCLNGIGQSDTSLQPWSLNFIASANGGLHFYRSTQAGKSSPVFKNGIGIHLNRKLWRGLKIGLECILSNTETKFQNYKTIHVYWAPGYQTTLYEINGNVKISESHILVPMFLRQHFGKRKRIYFEAGVHYKRLLSQVEEPDLVKTSYHEGNIFCSFNTSEISDDTLLDEPIESQPFYRGGPDNWNSFGYTYGIGAILLNRNKFKMNLGVRYNSFIDIFLSEIQNPRFRNIEIRMEVQFKPKKKAEHKLPLEF